MSLSAMGEKDRELVSTGMPQKRAFLRCSLPAPLRPGSAFAGEQGRRVTTAM